MSSNNDDNPNKRKDPPPSTASSNTMNGNNESKEEDLFPTTTNTEASLSSTTTPVAIASAAAAPTATATATPTTFTISLGVASSSNNHDDEYLARRWQALEQLTTIFGFPMELAESALETLQTTDVTLAYNYILDLDAKLDAGGPVTPIDTCPHVSAWQPPSSLLLPYKATAPAGLFEATCSHVDKNDGETTSKMGRLKAETTDDNAGPSSCPSRENWMCLQCGVIRCSRYQNGHSLEHWETTQQQEQKPSGRSGKDDSTTAEGHCLAVSLSDLSVWCYLCQAYLRTDAKAQAGPILHPLLQQFETLKFGDSNNTTNV